MAEIPDDGSRDEPPCSEFETTPLTRPEYIAALVHLYRGELTRANSWRVRLDNTTNWAVLALAAVLTYSFESPTRTHGALLLGLIPISIFWVFESRRFRLFDVWRSRVRKIEENFYGPILRRSLDSPEATWGNLVAEDLLRPRFKLSRFAALRARLLRTYWALFAILIGAWICKVLIHPTTVGSWAELEERLRVGEIPLWAELAPALAFVVFLVALVAFGPRVPVTKRGWYGESTDASALEAIDV